MRNLAARTALAILAANIFLAAQQVTIRMEQGAFVAEGPDFSTEPAGGWSSLFAVYAGSGDIPPVLGSYAVESGRLVFQPRFPLAAGVRARAVFQAPGAPPLESVFEIPKPAVTPSTRVEHVYPSADVLPANQLKLYIYFSAPMQSGRAWQHIRLLDAGGAVVPLAFLEIDQELWDENNQRLMVLFDPGRIKRGLASLAESGPTLVEGKTYTLDIDREWLDSRGAPLVSGFRKTFRAGAADRTPPDPAQWQLHPPRAGTSEPLSVGLGEPMEYALLHRMIGVAGPAGPLPGTIAVDRNETEWRFTPGEPWKPGDYRLVVDTALEDLAGNRIGRAFDVDTFQPAPAKVEGKTVSIGFRVGSE